MKNNLMILAPETPDLNRLFLHIYSVFHDEIEAYTEAFGHDSRMRLFVILKSIIFDYIPAVYPQYYANYPDSLNKIYDLIDEVIMAGHPKKNPQKASA